VLGHELEIVPLSDPLAIKPGQKLRVRVLFRGQLLAGGNIERGDRLTVLPEADIPRFTTDSDETSGRPSTCFMMGTQYLSMLNRIALSNLSRVIRTP
jgi:Domain of unknown function (DUF4198)